MACIGFINTPMLTCYWSFFKSKKIAIQRLPNFWFCWQLKFSNKYTFPIFSYSVVNREYCNLKLVKYVPTMEVRVKWKTCILLSETYNLLLWLLSFHGKFFHFDRPHHISLTHWLDILHSLFFVGHLLLVLKAAQFIWYIGSFDWSPL